MSIELIILSNLVTNEKYTRAVLPFLKADYFSDRAQRVVFEKIDEFVNKYTVLPTKESLAINISESNLDEGIFDEVIEIVKNIEPDENHFKWLYDESEQFCKKRALYNAMYMAIDIAESTDKESDPNSIPGMLMEALSVSFNSSVGHDYFEDAETHWTKQHSEDARHPFSIDVFNKITNGGIKTKSLNVVLAGINAGKSIHLVQQAADWLVRGKSVLYISMEMDEATCRERVDVITMDMTFGTVHALEKQQYLNRISALRAKTSGKLMVKEFPAGSAHVGHFRHLLQELKIKKQFVPDMICIDYLTICASSKLPASAKGNTNTYYGSVAEEIRAFAQELDIPIWTAVQLDRTSQGAADAGMGNVALAIGIAATADFMVVFLNPDDAVARGQVIGKIIKNRYHSYKGKFLLGLNPDKQRFYEIDQAGGMSEEELKELGLSTNVQSGTQVISRRASEEAMSGWDFGG